MSEDAKDLQAGGLGKIVEGITLVLAELKETGAIGTAGAGRGFDGISLSGMKLGHSDLTSAFESFCERWEWGVRTLVNEGNDFAEGVGLAAGTLHETDQYVDGALKVGVNSVIGNPYASEEDVSKMSYGDLVKHNALADPDYSKKSSDEADAIIRQGWKDAARDAATSNVTGWSPQQASGMSPEEYEAWLDSKFGPSAEERAEAAAKQGGGAG
ncbi:hypothetical protein CG723_38355 [Streptomyces sp. CB01635]|uniref:hypothetical protein n=1 Tax=unclassified Streptomyces TaxID=2593676 RepID=UPI000C27F8F2|nr:hypothetical protein [Streptomyces sp. CB01635]PJN06566.1 hypothetical protein CG723_38355 [Streptomyces sp. CB01635]